MLLPEILTVAAGYAEVLLLIAGGAIEYEAAAGDENDDSKA